MDGPDSPDLPHGTASSPASIHVKKQTCSPHEGKGSLALSGVSFCNQCFIQSHL